MNISSFVECLKAFTREGRKICHLELWTKVQMLRKSAAFLIVKPCLKKRLHSVNHTLFNHFLLLTSDEIEDTPEVGRTGNDDGDGGDGEKRGTYFGDFDNHAFNTCKLSLSLITERVQETSIVENNIMSINVFINSKISEEINIISNMSFICT
ncbi:LOW QUALITY PROTEIN: Protein of unknown function [Gryllus bimaculatus]|nr:LOW QUALITY PROTEIN: Protein of unknown function [Gryllus bimaculatus]